MTVAELIAKLSEYDLNKDVSVKVYNQYSLALLEDVVGVKQEGVVDHYTPKDSVVLTITDHHSDDLDRLRP